MIKKRCLALLVCIAILSIGCSKKKEEEDVVYQGKPLSAWIKMLEDTNPSTRFAAIHAVGKIGPEAREAIPALVETIRQTRNHDKRILFACNHALLAMGKEIVPDMISVLKDEDWEMRRGAAWILGKVGPDAKDAVPALTEALGDSNDSVRIKASEALKKIRAEEGRFEEPNSGQSISQEEQAED
jgi:HEAT repeat protein